jgi:hypothetical protein
MILPLYTRAPEAATSMAQEIPRLVWRRKCVNPLMQR